MTTPKRPDFNIFVNAGTEAQPRTEKIGVAWKHEKGDGLNINLFALPPTGKAVAFPYTAPKDSEESTES